MPKYTLQESFDKMVCHAATMTEKSIEKTSSTCFYRKLDEEGEVCSMCFVGALIEDGCYDKRMECMDADSKIVKKGLEESGHIIDTHLWQEAQAIHDYTSLANWESDLRGLAIKYELEFPEDVKFPVTLPN